MSGFKGLGVSKAPVTSTVAGIYSLKVDDINNGEYIITEDVLNKLVLCKTSVTQYYIAIFLLDIGKDGDFITFKNVEDQKNMYDLNLADTINTSDDAYLEFYGAGYSGDIFVPQIWGHFIEFNDTEITFVKEGTKWRRVDSTGMSRIQSDSQPIISKNALLMFNNRAIVFEGELAFQKGAKGDVFSRENVLRIYQNYTSFEKPLQPYPTNTIDIGTLLLRFKTLYAQRGDFSGTIKAADPVNATDLVNKQYLEANIPASVDFGNIPDLLPDGDNLRSIGNNTRRFIQVFVNKIGRDSANYIDLSSTMLSYWATSHNFRAQGNTIFNLYIDKMLLYKNLIPNSTNTKDIGSDLLRFNNIYAQNGDFSGTVKASDPVDATDLVNKQYLESNRGISKLLDDPSPKLSAILDCNYKKLINVQNPSSSFDAAHKGYVDAFKINSNSTDLGGAASYSIINGDWNTILVITNTIQSTLDITISPVMGNFVDIFNATEFDLTVSSSNGKTIKSLNNFIKIPKYGKATLKSAGGYYMLYGDLKA